MIGIVSTVTVVSGLDTMYRDTRPPTVCVPAFRPYIGTCACPRKLHNRSERAGGLMKWRVSSRTWERDALTECLNCWTSSLRRLINSPILCSSKKNMSWNMYDWNSTSLYVAAARSQRRPEH